VTPLTRVRGTRYVVPLREGGSLPGIVEADDLGTYVVKFRGAGQGPRVLVAEVVVAGLAEALGLPTPRQVVLDVPAALTRYEADEEVQDLLRASVGPNLGVDFLPGAFGFDATTTPEPDVAARVLWLDALCANVDRSWRNPNLLWWHDRLWVIDHGASLYFHHSWSGGVTDPARFAAQAWNDGDHLFREHADRARALDAELRSRLDEDLVADVVDRVPDDWLDAVPGAEDPAALRAAYRAFLGARLATDAWLPGGAR